MDAENIDIGTLKEDEIMPAFANVSNHHTKMLSNKQKLKLARDKEFVIGIIDNLAAGTLAAINLLPIAALPFVAGMYEMYKSAKKTNEIREINTKIVATTQKLERLQEKLILYENMFVPKSQNPKINNTDIRNALIETKNLQKEGKETRKTYVITGAIFAATTIVPILTGISDENQVSTLLTLSALSASIYSFSKAISNALQMDNEKERISFLEIEDTILTIEKFSKMLKREKQKALIKKIQRVGQIDDTLYDIEEPNIR